MWLGSDNRRGYLSTDHPPGFLKRDSNPNVFTFFWFRLPHYTGCGCILHPLNKVLFQFGILHLHCPIIYVHSTFRNAPLHFQWLRKNILISFRLLYQYWPDIGNSLVVQWLGLDAFTAVAPSSIPSWATKILQAANHGQKKKLARINF